MNFDIEPYIKVGDLYFGESIESVRLKLSPHQYMNSKLEYEVVFYKDYYEDFDLIVGSDSNLIVEYFEFFPDPIVAPTVTYRGIELFKVSYLELYDTLYKFDRHIVKEYDMFTSYELGIGVANPMDENSKSVPSSIIVFKENYYSNV